MVVGTSPFTEVRPDQFQGTYGMLHLFTDVGIRQGIMSPEKGKMNARCPLSYYTIPSIGTTDSSHVPIEFLSQECLLSAMRSAGLVFFKENQGPLNTRVFSLDTKTGVQTTTSALVLPGLFKCPELQKEVTPQSLTASYGSMSFPDVRVDGQ